MPATWLLARSSVMSSTPPPRFGVIVPVKPPAVAKSRLAPLGDAVRRDLVVAFAVDTVTAVLEAPLVGEVLVVTDDHLLAQDLADLGVQVLPDGATDDLNGSLVQAAAELHRRRPDLSPVALCADLPALRTEDLTRALVEAGRHDVAFVADAQGVGTTLLTARHLDDFAPRFGAGSRAAHLDAGAHEVTALDVPSLRRDVDTPADLDAAIALGVGSCTGILTTALRL